MKYIAEIYVSDIRERSIEAYEPSEEEIKQLSTSIAEVGLIHPVVVRPVDGGLELVSGQVRKRAMEQLGKRKMPVFSKQMTDEQCRQLIAAENLCRRGQAPITVAKQMKALNVDGDSLRDIARAVSCSHQTVANYLKLMETPKEIQKLIEQQDIVDPEICTAEEGYYR